MGAIYTCCSWGIKGHDREEKNAILRHEFYQEFPAPNLSEDSRVSVSSGGDLSQEFLPATGTDPDRPLRRTPRKSSGHAEPDSDEELQAFITMRNQTDKATEEWEKLNYDIHSLKCSRREVNTRWKKILLLLGYQREVDALLSVNRQTALLESENLDKARELLQSIMEESGLFPPGIAANDRYAFVLDRLISLDSAEEFVRLAKEKYPKAWPQRERERERENEL
ncbi:melanoregulin-like [Clupea harengus]|uniref:Melanoregulin-like n=1 Tax=Clupea harengus TaxID=7950 RepID=A0A6P8GHP7_CLUHA|nr:melanoregulin-like [Clupea harengus]